MFEISFLNLEALNDFVIGASLSQILGPWNRIDRSIDTFLQLIGRNVLECAGEGVFLYRVYI